jgi:murein DD-endopeptidase MepM/ murein hydrolase activator NlpD
MKYWRVKKVHGSIGIIGLFVVLFSCSTPVEQVAESEIPVAEPELVYGFSHNDYRVEYDTIQDGWTLSHMLAPHGVNPSQINEADALSRDSSVNLKFIVAGKPYAVFYPQGDTSGIAHHIVYEPFVTHYVVFSFSDSISVRKVERPVTVSRTTLTGEIEQNSTLTHTIQAKLDNMNMTGELAELIAGIFAYSIDFFKLHPGDQFKLIYEEKSVDGTPFGFGKVEAAWFYHQGSPYYAFHFANDSLDKVEGYYDENGKELKRPFLMSPVKFSRISSGFSANRFHPVQKRYKAHLGTDYAAPHGTPIFTTADGSIIEASSSQFNGIYVKVRHNDTYTTQYLHMSRIETGIKPGVRVKQGQTIGYVGSTGLATGPHVCYRFWKNGKQVDHRAEKLPNTIPLRAELLPVYRKHIAPLKADLEKTEVTNASEKKDPQLADFSVFSRILRLLGIRHLPQTE